MSEGEEKIVYKDLSYQINGFLFKTHQELGKYRKEKQYGDYLEDLLKINNINYQREFRIVTKEKVRDIVDFIIDDKIILELKVVDFLSKEDYYQVQKYLQTLNLKLGLLINFRQNRVVIKRVLNSSYIS